MRLACINANGHFPKVKTPTYPNGIYFRDGILDVTDEGFKELQGNEEFMRHFDKDVITEWKPEAKPVTVESLTAENKALKNMISLQQKQIAELSEKLKS